ncbi:hypothetical protein [Burkholderia metallica]|uniref:hypothetical protein n=1 Tax=Burkholderia metallica TaxID=488729 RepID=UPI001CF14091|nr:hypothetical protein [Burkholderia metallica]MCA8003517.1 hypothetical protein [Burkholderia metallica]
MSNSISKTPHIVGAHVIREEGLGQGSNPTRPAPAIITSRERHGTRLSLALNDIGGRNSALNTSTSAAEGQSSLNVGVAFRRVQQGTQGGQASTASGEPLPGPNWHRHQQLPPDLRQVFMALNNRQIAPDAVADNVLASLTQDLATAVTAVRSWPSTAAGGLRAGTAAAAQLATNLLGDARTSMAQGRSALSTFGHAAVEQGGRVFGNTFDGDQALKGWSSNFINAATHEIVSTGVATALRELVGAGTEELLKRYDVSPEARAMGAAALFTVAIMGNLMALAHKYQKGIASGTTVAGHTIQTVALLGATIGAGVSARRQNGNGQFGTLSTLLPSALKAYAYTARDVINMMAPLTSNHDATFVRPVLTQSLDAVPFVANQYLVNEGQSTFGVSGAGFVDGLREHSFGVAEGMKALTSYVGSNVAGESADAIVVRLVNEVTTHGVTHHALDAVSKLRMHWSTIDTSSQSFRSQLADKAAGSGIARVSLFLTIYGLSAVVDHLLSGTSWSNTTKNHAENAIGALMVVAGCVGFVMSTAGKSVTPDTPTPSSESRIEEV